ncbi:MAG: carbon-nitrogen hydrolase family protein [Planctomycetia bacterium]|nr:carbon-nitrogen hydrolase family protein [Planctomycetia bacterium]
MLYSAARRQFKNWAAIPLGFSLLLIALTGPLSAEQARPSTSRTVKVAAVQCSADLGEVAANTKKLTKLAQEAARNGAKIVVLPEAAITGYLSQDGKTDWHVAGRPMEKEYVGKDPAGYAETVPGPSTRHFCALAKSLGIYLTIPLLEVDCRDGTDKPRYFNTVCLANPRGELVVHYRKIHPWPHAEKSWATPGDRGLQTYDTEYGRVGIAVCFDIHFILDQYQSKHLWTMLFSTAWADGQYPAEWFYHQLPAKVKRFDHNLIAANWSVDEKQAWRGFGFSVIISKQGEVLSTAKRIYGSDIVYADLPVAASAQAKASTSEVSGRRRRFRVLWGR